MMMKIFFLLFLIIPFFVSCTDGDDYITTENYLGLEGVTARITPDKESYSLNGEEDIVLSIYCDADFERYRNYEYSFYCHKSSFDEDGMTDLLILENADDTADKNCMFTKYLIKSNINESSMQSYTRDFHLKPLSAGWYYLTVYFTAQNGQSSQRYRHSTQLLFKVQ